LPLQPRRQPMNEWIQLTIPLEFDNINTKHQGKERNEN